MTDFLSPRPSALGPDEFIKIYGGVYEHSPWVVEALADCIQTGGVDTPQGLSEAMRDVVDAAERDKQMALILAHPDLAGKAAIAGNLTRESTEEQSRAGLDRCSADQFGEFLRLNTAYREKFGFPFIIAARFLTRDDILYAFRNRVNNEVDDEFEEAIQQIHLIARYRLDAMAVTA